MTARKAKHILKRLDGVIEEMEDQAVHLWAKEDSLRTEILNQRLTERYTCRRALRSWLNRNTR